jgi:ribosomal protein L44E
MSNIRKVSRDSNGRRRFKWCPDGCGKQVEIYNKHKTKLRIFWYRCNVCGKKYLKEQLTL